jgi:hypothetical protein
MKTQAIRTCETQQISPKRKFIAMTAHINNTERPHINDLILYVKCLEKIEQAKPKTSRRREIIKIRAKINEIETKKTIQRFNEIKR